MLFCDQVKNCGNVWTMLMFSTLKWHLNICVAHNASVHVLPHTRHLLNVNTLSVVYQANLPDARVKWCFCAHHNVCQQYDAHNCGAVQCFTRSADGPPGSFC